VIRQTPNKLSPRRASPTGPLLTSVDWRRLRIWYRDYGRRLPWRHEATPWSILLAETLLHRTGANVVQVLYPFARKVFPSPRSVILKKSRWISMLYKGGLFWRARIFVRACENLVRHYGGQVPSERKELESLPGVGHYTASAVRCFGFGHREFITDTNTIRLVGRIAGKRLNPASHRTKSIQALTARLSNNGRPPLAKDNYALLDLAATVCKPREPMCHKCPLRSRCHTAQIRKGKRFLQR
jgi:A/G-specific adenine glycosylase